MVLTPREAPSCWPLPSGGAGREEGRTSAETQAGAGQPRRLGRALRSLPPQLLRLPQHHPTRELVVHAATIFGDLQSFMRQELDQAVATQALWQALSSRQRVSSRPEGRSGGLLGH